MTNDRALITAQLVSMDVTGAHIWSEEYNRVTSSDIFASSGRNRDELLRTRIRSGTSSRTSSRESRGCSRRSLPEAYALFPERLT